MAKRISKKQAEVIRQDILAHFRKVEANLDFVISQKGKIAINCNHGDCDRIGQYCLRTYPKQVYTYYAYHGFRRGALSIFFK